MDDVRAPASASTGSLPNSLASQQEPMYDLRRVARIPFATETEIASQLAHPLVAARVDREHGADATLPRDAYEVSHQYGAEPLALPRIGNGDRALA
jgi:hypothetical protein